MTATQRTQYLYGRSFVELEDRQELRAFTVAAAAPVGRTRNNSHADLRQAEYYQELLADLRAAVNAELAHHDAALPARETRNDVSEVKRSQRIIQVKEAELAAIDQLTAALSSRFPTSEIRDHDHGSSPVHRVDSSLATTAVALDAPSSIHS